MTNEDLIRLDQRVIALEGIVAGLQQQAVSLEVQLAAANTRVETLNNFYGSAIGEMTGRFMSLLDKVTGGTTAP